jgi:hypothetical protein
MYDDAVCMYGQTAIPPEKDNSSPINSPEEMRSRVNLKYIDMKALYEFVIEK